MWWVKISEENSEVVWTTLPRYALLNSHEEQVFGLYLVGTSFSSQTVRCWAAGVDCPQPEEKGATEDEMVGWHHWLSGHECEQTLGESEGQRNLASCSPWGHKEVDTTERQNNETHTKWTLNFKAASVWLKHCFLMEGIHGWKSFHRTFFSPL